EEALAWSLSKRLAKVRPSLTVATAYDGASALAMLRAEPVDLLVADIRMPGMSGIDLVLAAMQLNPDLRVVVMTAFRATEIDRWSGSSGIQFLDEPFAFEQFVEVVDGCLDLDHTGFSGAISVQTLPDIVQLYILSNAIGALTVKSRRGEGCLWFE